MGKVLRNPGPFLAGAGFVWRSRRGQWSERLERERKKALLIDIEEEKKECSRAALRSARPPHRPTTRELRTIPSATSSNQGLLFDR